MPLEREWYNAPTSDPQCRHLISGIIHVDVPSHKVLEIDPYTNDKTKEQHILYPMALHDNHETLLSSEISVIDFLSCTQICDSDHIQFDNIQDSDPHLQHIAFSIFDKEDSDKCQKEHFPEPPTSTAHPSTEVNVKDVCDIIPPAFLLCSMFVSDDYS